MSNSKLRDIEASANTFFNSIASNFNMVGYNQDILKDYVPALVYTMYDGYYIYSPYTNTLDNTNSNEVMDEEGNIDNKTDAEILNQGNSDATYKDGEKISGLKPYIYYSCRYKYNGNDFVITYSLDNYITIQGEITVNGVQQWVYDYGYLLDNISISGNSVTYRDVSIKQDEELKETICDPETGNIEIYSYIKLNGVKYYKDNDGSWFSILNGKKYKQDNFNPTTTSAIEYYKEADEFKKRIIYQYNLSDLTANCAVDENGNKLTDKSGNSKFGNKTIFDFGDYNNGSIEDPNSNFNEQRLAVIRYSIEKNLSIAIANYNSGVTTKFLMPELKEDEWDKIINNVSIISFLQGLNIGGKVYNGYSIITNNKNEEVVNEDSIYILTNDNKYHRANDNDLIGNTEIKIGVLNIDFERKSTTVNEITKYYIPKQVNGENPITGCYNSIVSQSNVSITDNFYQYMQNKGNLASVYYTALARERYGLYKTNNNPDTLKEKFGVTN